jgi:hypothetical protein
VSNTFFRNARNEVVKIIFPGLSLETWYRDMGSCLEEFRKKSTANITVSVWLNPNFRNYLILNIGFRFSVNAFNPS